MVAPVSAATEFAGEAEFQTYYGQGSHHLESENTHRLGVDGSTAASPVAYTLEVSATNVTIDWHRISKVGVGRAPANPSSSIGSADKNQYQSGTRNLGAATLEMTVHLVGANLLVAPSTPVSASLSLNSFGSVQLNVSQREAWSAGEFAQSIGVGGRSGFVYRAMQIDSGQVRFESTGDTSGTMNGDLTLVIWGGTIKSSSPRGPEAFQSGTWIENETGTGPASIRDEYSQLLVISLAQARMDFDVVVGKTRWVAPSATATTDGSVRLSQATATLNTRDARYQADTESVDLSGSISTNLTGSQEGLIGRFGGRLDSVSLTPAAELASADGARPWWLVGALALPVALPVALAYRRHRKRAPSDEELLRRAEDALVDKMPAAAIQVAQQLLARDRTDADAWFVYGAALVQEKKFGQLLQELEPAFHAVPSGREGLAFLLAYGEASMNRDPRRWLTIAARDPMLKTKIAEEPIFSSQPLGKPVSENDDGRTVGYV